ncbi:MAG: heavy metal-associated domain-containing protein [Sulfurimonas sp.]|nr:heavy metal-associated domain-containing protein [Sulfurimonas sp.]
MGRIVVLFLLLSVVLFAKEWNLHISGMHCIACTLAVKKSLLSIDGVTEAKVNFKNQIALVKAKDSVTLREMQEAIEATGYQAEAL